MCINLTKKYVYIHYFQHLNEVGKINVDIEFASHGPAVLSMGSQFIPNHTSHVVADQDTVPCFHMSVLPAAAAE
jgi:hypothetical protein